MPSSKYILAFENIDLSQVPLVGGKNASLGEMYRALTPQGVQVPDGFATTSEAYWDFLHDNGIYDKLTRVLQDLDTENFSNLSAVGETARELILNAALSDEFRTAIHDAHRQLEKKTGQPLRVAVRSSATAEDLPDASFAGLHETFLNVEGGEALWQACQRCFASLFTDRAIKYRVDHGFEHMKVALSVGVQQMVRADLACSGVSFTLDPETGFRNVVLITGIWGLGENLVQGKADPDEFILFKPSIGHFPRPAISKKIRDKTIKMVYAGSTDHRPGATTVNVETTPEERHLPVLSDEEVILLGKWSLAIEQHYERPMDIEWAKDGIDQTLYIVQARPETVHASAKDLHVVRSFHIKEKGKILARGTALGSKIASGKARILDTPADAGKLQPGEVLVTDITNPDWDPVMKKAAAIVTNKGGRTSHAAIVAREIGVVAIVGTGDATEAIRDGEEVTVSCAEGKEGKVYEGILEWEEKMLDMHEIKMPETKVMLILGDPDRAFQHSFLPNNGIGLMRLEFVIGNSIRIHPMALVRFRELKDPEARKEIEKRTAHYRVKEDYFVEKLAEAVGTIAAAFHPKDVVVRMSDFKSNEYANLIGGKQFEPKEENPMLGFRGASRYYSDRYRAGFRLECEAMKRVRHEMGLTNVKLMIPFCRTVEEGQKVVNLMAEYGLNRGDDGLEIYVMTEIPANVILAERFAEIFDGFSIGSNDLTQLMLGLDRDSFLVSNLFDERNDAVKEMIAQAIAVARKKGKKIGLCGQGPSDLPDFAQFLVNCGIDNMSFNPDALLQGIENINAAEKKRNADRKKKALKTSNHKQ